MSADEFLTVTQVAAKLELRERVISRYVEAGKIPHRRIGKAIRFRWADVLTWWESLPGTDLIKQHPVNFRDPSSASGGTESTPTDTTHPTLPFTRGARRHKIAPEAQPQTR